MLIPRGPPSPLHFSCPRPQRRGHPLGSPAHPGPPTPSWVSGLPPTFSRVRPPGAAPGAGSARLPARPGGPRLPDRVLRPSSRESPWLPRGSVPGSASSLPGPHPPTPHPQPLRLASLEAPGPATLLLRGPARGSGGRGPAAPRPRGPLLPARPHLWPRGGRAGTAAFRAARR